MAIERSFIYGLKASYAPEIETRNVSFAVMEHTPKFGLYPVRLPNTPPEGLPIPLSDRPINERVCEFIGQYEEHLSRTLPGGTQLVRRPVLGDTGLFAPLLPPCPPLADCEQLPCDKIDCVACVFEVRTSFWARGCHVLRVRAAPTQITYEVSIAGVLSLLGIVPLQFWSVLYFLFSIGETEYAQQLRAGGTPKEHVMKHAVENARGKQTYVTAAIHAALSSPPQSAPSESGVQVGRGANELRDDVVPAAAVSAGAVPFPTPPPLELEGAAPAVAETDSPAPHPPIPDNSTVGSPGAIRSPVSRVPAPVQPLPPRPRRQARGASALQHDPTPVTEESTDSAVTSDAIDSPVTSDTPTGSQKRGPRPNAARRNPP